MEHLRTLTWPGGEHVFGLRLGELRALQDATDSGPEEVLARVMSRLYRVDDVLAVLRLGLIGGGMNGAEASRVVTAAAESAPFAILRAPAADVLSAALWGVEDDEPGKPEGDGAPPASGNGQSSTLADA